MESILCRFTEHFVSKTCVSCGTVVLFSFKTFPFVETLHGCFGSRCTATVH